MALLPQIKGDVGVTLLPQIKGDVGVYLLLQSKDDVAIKAKKLHILIWMWSFFYQVKLLILAYLRIS
ncbi:hypothetical protein [Anaerobiospirillum succiniciproducens]|uniref:hypothetical protein n=1 Tax=Anaerobiospirillum succiniciproducens TaxID=13335 RepID=UPI002942F1D0|nr:hypothetical protein [Anaerobiospirillum succiniciproducens]